MTKVEVEVRDDEVPPVAPPWAAPPVELQAVPPLAVVCTPPVPAIPPVAGPCATPEVAPPEPAVDDMLVICALLVPPNNGEELPPSEEPLFAAVEPPLVKVFAPAREVFE